MRLLCDYTKPATAYPAQVFSRVTLRQNTADIGKEGVFKYGRIAYLRGALNPGVLQEEKGGLACSSCEQQMASSSANSFGQPAIASHTMEKVAFHSLLE